MNTERKPADHTVIPDATGPLVRAKAALAQVSEVRRNLSAAKLHLEAMAQLRSLSADLPAPPATFEATKSYHVHLKRPVQNASGRWLRPSDDVVMLGEFAETVKDAIDGAQVL